MCFEMNVRGIRPGQTNMKRREPSCFPEDPTLRQLNRSCAVGRGWIARNEHRSCNVDEHSASQSSAYRQQNQVRNQTICPMWSCVVWLVETTLPPSLCLHGILECAVQSKRQKRIRRIWTGDPRTAQTHKSTRKQKQISLSSVRLQFARKHLPAHTHTM